MKIKDHLKWIARNPYHIVGLLAYRGVFDWMKDEAYLKLLYKSWFGKRIDLNDPKSFNEKMQWLKLYDHKPEYTQMVDKYEVKKYVAERIGEEYIIPTLGIWDSFDEIDFDSLPDQFVLKCTHDSGSVFVCRDKAKLDKSALKHKLNRRLKRKYYIANREWPYRNVKPRIMAECYMEDVNQPNGLRDNKFYCFDGEPKLLYVSEGLENHETAKISFLNIDWTFAPFRRLDYKPFDKLPPKPEHFEHMCALARQLSQDVPFLRVDLYEINGKVYFSELTFFPCGGFILFHPAEWDEKLGLDIKLPESK